MEFAKEIHGKSIRLELNEPSFERAQLIFSIIQRNVEHVGPWFEWVEKTNRVEDTYNHLLKSFESKNKKEYGILVASTYVGSISVHKLNDSFTYGELGYWIDVAHAKQGYTSLAVQALTEYLLSIGLKRIVIKCAPHNIASASVAKKCGFQYEGELRNDRFISKTQSYENSLLFSRISK